MRQAPTDSEGFELIPLYRGSTQPETRLEARWSAHKPVGAAVHLSEHPEVANSYAWGPGQELNGANVAQYYARGPLATMDEWTAAIREQPTFDSRILRDLDAQRAFQRSAIESAVRSLQSRGYNGVRGKIWYNDGEVAVWDPANLRPRFSDELREALRERMA